MPKPTQKEIKTMTASLVGDIVTILSTKKGLMLAARGGIAKTIQTFEDALFESKEDDWE